jgi:hypothetical protein
MRKSIYLIILCGLAACLCGGCASYNAPVIPPQGWLYTDISAPLSTNFTDTPVCEKHGSASTVFLHIPLGAALQFAWDRADIETAAKAGGLKTVEYADYNRMQVLGIFGRFTVTAYGN